MEPAIQIGSLFSSSSSCVFLVGWEASVNNKQSPFTTSFLRHSFQWIQCLPSFLQFSLHFSLPYPPWMSSRSLVLRGPCQIMSFAFSEYMTLAPPFFPFYINSIVVMDAKYFGLREYFHYDYASMTTISESTFGSLEGDISNRPLFFNFF